MKFNKVILSSALLATTFGSAYAAEVSVYGRLTGAYVHSSNGVQSKDGFFAPSYMFGPNFGLNIDAGKQGSLNVSGKIEVSANGFAGGTSNYDSTRGDGNGLTARSVYLDFSGQFGSLKVGNASTATDAVNYTNSLNGSQVLSVDGLVQSTSNLAFVEEDAKTVGGNFKASNFIVYGEGRHSGLHYSSVPFYGVSVNLSYFNKNYYNQVEGGSVSKAAKDAKSNINMLNYALNYNRDFGDYVIKFVYAGDDYPSKAYRTDDDGRRVALADKNQTQIGFAVKFKNLGLGDFTISVASGTKESDILDDPFAAWKDIKKTGKNTITDTRVSLYYAMGNLGFGILSVDGELKRTPDSGDDDKYTISSILLGADYKLAATGTKLFASYGTSSAQSYSDPTTKVKYQTISGLLVGFRQNF